ncbi:MAG: response regulator [Chloroflexi bacterium]|nr:response regulator [Chloroflexota bacterium]
MKTRILIIEDDEQSRYLLSVILEHHGYQVIQACDGYEGIEAAKQARPALILLDLLLPGLDGYAVAQKLRRDSAFTRVPILAVTAIPMMSNHKRALAAGCTDYIEKPVDQNFLIDRIKEHLRSDEQPDNLLNPGGYSYKSGGGE